MSWGAGPFLSFDVESTGVDVENDRIVTAAVVDIEPGKPVRTRTWILNPGIAIPEGATAIHGVTTERARAEGQHPSVALDEIALELTVALAAGTPLVAMNASFDFTMLDRELLRYKLGGLADRLGGYEGLRPVLDPFVLDREVDKYRKGKRTLSSLCTHYRVDIGTAHDAAADALAACRVLFRIAKQYPRSIGTADLHELHDKQVQWHHERQTDFAEYRERIGEPLTDISTEWPIRRPVEEKAA